MSEEIINWLSAVSVAIIPTLTAVAGIIAALGKIIHNLKDYHSKSESEQEEIKGEIHEINEEIYTVIRENRQLKEDFDKLYKSIYRISEGQDERGNKAP